MDGEINLYISALEPLRHVLSQFPIHTNRRGHMHMPGKHVTVFWSRVTTIFKVLFKSPLKKIVNTTLQYCIGNVPLGSYNC